MVALVVPLNCDVSVTAQPVVYDGVDEDEFVASAAEIAAVAALPVVLDFVAVLFAENPSSWRK